MGKLLLPNLSDISEVIKDIERVSSSIGVSPREMTVAQYSKNGGRFDGRSLLQVGGFSKIVNNIAPVPEHLDSVINGTYLKNRNNYVKKLEKIVGEGSYVRQCVFDGFEAALKAHGAFNVSQVKQKTVVKAKQKKARANCVLISDTHMGLKISPDEILNNGYDWDIAARRMGKLTEQVSLYKMDHRNDCNELNVCLGGDLGQGIIHLNDSGTDLITYQVVGIASYLTQMIDYWRNFYPSIRIHCTPDNHMRLPHKGKERATSQKFDSFATMIHVMLQSAFRTCTDVSFNMPKTAITSFDILGHHYGLTHGDGHIMSGNLGQSVNVKSIANQCLRLNAAAPGGRKYDAILLGHVHTPIFMHLNETSTYLVVNGTGSGTDGYAETLGYFKTMPCQVMFEVTENYPVGDFRIVDLADADTNDTYLQYVKPYNYDLSVK